jgi:AraC family transcriptional regulator
MLALDRSDRHVPLVNPALTVLRSSADFGWNAVLVEHVRLSGGELYVPRLDDHLVCMVLDADYHLEQVRNGKTFNHTFQPGQAQILPISTSGFWRNKDSVELLHLQFSHSFIQRIAQEIAHAEPNRVEIIDKFLIEDPQVMHIGYALFAELLDGGLNGISYSDALATALATHLLRRYALLGGAVQIPLPRISRNELGRALQYINDHLSEQLSLETLAQQVNLSTSHFNALFRQHIGIAPYQYILQQRVNRAKELLLRTELSIAQVAADVGFYDQSHLTRHMRQLLNVTPAALRHHQNVQNPR